MNTNLKNKAEEVLGVMSGKACLAVAEGRELVCRKSEAINQVVVIAIILVVSILAVLLYWGLAEGVINDVFNKVKTEINKLL